MAGHGTGRGCRTAENIGEGVDAINLKEEEEQDYNTVSTVRTLSYTEAWGKAVEVLMEHAGVREDGSSPCFLGCRDTLQITLTCNEMSIGAARECTGRSDYFSYHWCSFGYVNEPDAGEDCQLRHDLRSSEWGVLIDKVFFYRNRLPTSLVQNGYASLPSVLVLI